MIELKDRDEWKMARPTHHGAHRVYNSGTPPISSVRWLLAQRCHLIMTESIFSRTNMEFRFCNDTLDITTAPVRIITLVEELDN
jgi:hypothetical protein